MLSGENVAKKTTSKAFIDEIPLIFKFYGTLIKYDFVNDINDIWVKISSNLIDNCSNCVIIEPGPNLCFFLSAERV